jgi:hypothetical protein
MDEKTEPIAVLGAGVVCSITGMLLLRKSFSIKRKAQEQYGLSLNAGSRGPGVQVALVWRF